MVSDQLYLPYVVVCELDKLKMGRKDGSKDKDVSSYAQQAIKFINYEVQLGGRGRSALVKV